jgi:hypothetical protein
VAGLDPNIPIVEALGPGQSLAEHFQEMLAFYSRRIEADPLDAYAYSSRARYYDYLHERATATADMRRFSAILNEGATSDLRLGTPRRLRGVVDGPFGYQLAFSVGGRDNGIQVLCVAFGQKGRGSSMKSFEIPMLVMSLFGFGLLSGLDAPSAYADFTFGEPVKFGSIYVSSTDDVDCFSSDGLEMYIDRGLGGGNGDLWVLKRASVDDDWGPPVNLGPAVNSEQEDAIASMSADGLTLYFQSTRPGGFGRNYIYMTTRASRSAPWGPAVNMGSTLNSSPDAGEPWISADGLELYFASYQSGGYGGKDIWIARRATENDPWGVPVNLGPVVNSAYGEGKPCLSPDGLLLFFEDYGSPRPGGYGDSDFWMTRRASLSDPWQTPVNLGPKVNGPGLEFLPRVSPDGRTLYFWAIRDGVGDVWQAPIIPTVDFNGDGKVDIQDLLRLIESWGKDDPSVDIGPMPWGDGRVDEKDLEVLMSYWGQEIGLIACWKLDETEGLIAHDSAGKNDATVVGTPLWQPEGGKVGGALQMSGASNFIMTHFACDPSQGSLSVFAWIKGGAPGQVILSQAGSVNWLMASAADGVLATELRESSRKNESLTSAAVITDSNWHRVGFVWDGTNRILYVDDVEVTRDRQASLAASAGSLSIGAGSTMAATSFWTGLIDDLRIYERAVKP